jgi:hypothetical protein
MATNSHPAPAPAAPPAEETFPQHSASEAPVRRADRVAFQIWVVCVLLTLVITLVLYLVDRIAPVL